jgi:hypothetical protein
MKPGPDALGTVETSPGAQNMKTIPNAFGTVKNEYESAKHANETRHPQYHRK